MKQKKLFFLVNPHAGKAEIRGKTLDTIDRFIKYGYEVTVHVTQRALEIPELVENRAHLYDMIVCCGGDGTLNETVSGIMRNVKRPILGYIPAGTVNDFASSLHIPKDISQAAVTVTDGIPYPVDIGSFDERFFTYIAAFGAFTEVSYQTPQQSKNILGRAAYILEAIRRLPTIKAYHMSIVHDDGKKVEGDFIFGMISNSTSVGGIKLREGRNVSMNDGLLEVVLVRNPKTVLEAQALITTILHQDLNSEFIVSFHTTQLQVHASEPVPWTLDGEFGGIVNDVRIQNHKHAIRVMVNKPSLKKAVGKRQMAAQNILTQEFFKQSRTFQ